MSTLLSFDLKADFGFLKKPDTNEPMYLTFNMIHKPVVLGILGAIIGLKGFREANTLPDYYEELKSEKIGIIPLEAEKGAFPKTAIKYNNSTGLANKSSIGGATLNVVEQTLIRPSYRIFLLTDREDLIEAIQNQEAAFLPYLGKNDFSAWWDNVQTYDYKPFEPVEPFQIASIFMKKQLLKDGKYEDESLLYEMDISEENFVYFERLPVSYDEYLIQYQYAPFAYTNFKLKQGYVADNLYKLDNDAIIQLF